MIDTQTKKIDAEPSFNKNKNSNKRSTEYNDKSVFNTEDNKNIIVFYSRLKYRIPNTSVLLDEKNKKYLCELWK